MATLKSRRTSKLGFAASLAGVALLALASSCASGEGGRPIVARKDMTHALGMKDEINADAICKFDFLRNIVSLVRIAPNAPAQNKKYVH